MATPDSSVQPKIVHTLLKRTAGFLLAFAAIFGGIRYVQSLQGDFDLGGESEGMIAAIRLEREGQQAAIIKPDGTVLTTKSWRPGMTDREPAWAPDGKYLFFTSDRKENTFHVFRWNPQRDDAESRTLGRTSRANPTFAPGGDMESFLIVMGGTVRELNPTTMKTPQILPPSNSEIAQSTVEEGGGAEGSFGAIYGGLGKSFRIARYTPEKRFIVAIMKRDEGELLVLQDLQPKNDRLPRPLPIAAGDRIEFDIDPKTGSVVYTVQGFRWPDPKAAPEQFRKGNKVTVPFRNMVGMVDPAKGQGIIAASSDDKVGFGAPRVSPDGSRLVIVQGKIEDGALRPAALLTLPYQNGGIQAASVLVQGEIFEPSWSLDGKKLVYAKRANGKRDLFTIGADGSGEQSITKGEGDYSTPIFSPMIKV